MQLDFDEAIKKHRGSTYPGKGDERIREGSIFPVIKPKFSLDLSGPVFTLGSCFARNIEIALQSLGVELPTMAFSVPPAEWEYRPNGLLNEYNPGTMSQRILHALQHKSFPEKTIMPTQAGHCDLLLPGGADVTLQRALERRKEIDAVYAHLPRATCLILTLGFVETWFDLETGLYLNRLPPPAVAHRSPGRFVFRRLDAAQCYEQLETALSQLPGMKIIVTVSPVPIQRTFTGDDCAVANEYSKATLRVCADQLAKRFDNVDYFPSYEIVRSGGLSNHRADGMHVKLDLVQVVVEHMLKSYQQAQAQA